MFSRRDMMRFFGVGALIAPIIGGESESAMTAELIEMPKIRPVELHTQIPKPLDLRDIKRVDLVITLRDGSMRRIDSDWADALSWKKSSRPILTGERINLSIDLSVIRADRSPRWLEAIGSMEAEGTLL